MSYYQMTCMALASSYQNYKVRLGVIDLMSVYILLHRLDMFFL
jgi:hypothetical protein